MFHNTVSIVCDNLLEEKKTITQFSSCIQFIICLMPNSQQEHFFCINSTKYMCYIPKGFLSLNEVLNEMLKL